MTAKKWLLSFLLTALALALLLGAFNVATDPFGVFGDPLFDWWSYNMTNNPRAAKIRYLADHLDEYDSYIVGCSSTSSFSVETLNHYYGDTSFYNMIMYGADMLDCEQTVAWLLEKDEVKLIWLNVYLDNGAEYATESNAYTHSMDPRVDGTSPLGFYARYLFLNPAYGMAKIENAGKDTWLAQSFDVFDVESGAYDKKKRDVEPISDMERYLAAYPVFADYPSGQNYTLPAVQSCVDSVGRIKAMCEEAGATLTVVTSPVYGEYLNYFDRADVASFYTALAQVTEYWDFSCSSVSYEPRYFYDSTHFRNAVGDMAIARIFGDTSVYVPEDFGVYVTAENAAEHFAASADAAPLAKEKLSREIPVLMYHHIGEEINDVTVSPATFESHMQALLKAGYTTVSMKEINDYVMGNGELPEKPLLITFDDGYESNYTIAYPILQKYGMKAAVFVIGSSVGKSTYKDTENAIIPHFSYEEMKIMAESGLVEIGSHTYDLHQAQAYETGIARQDMSPLEGEGEEDYLRLIKEDVSRSLADIEKATGEAYFPALAYPRGVWNDRAAAVLADLGVKITFSTEEGVHTFVKGLRQSMYAVKRFNVGGDVSAEALLERIEK